MCDIRAVPKLSDGVAGCPVGLLRFHAADSYIDPHKIGVLGFSAGGHMVAAPTFLLHAQDDPTDPVENSLVYYAALRRAGVSAEMHLFAKGGHAFGLRRMATPITAWPQLVETWFETIGLIAR